MIGSLIHALADQAHEETRDDGRKFDRDAYVEKATAKALRQEYSSGKAHQGVADNQSSKAKEASDLVPRSHDPLLSHPAHAEAAKAHSLAASRYRSVAAADVGVGERYRQTAAALSQRAQATGSREDHMKAAIAHEGLAEHLRTAAWRDPEAADRHVALSQAHSVLASSGSDLKAADKADQVIESELGRHSAEDLEKGASRVKMMEWNVQKAADHAAKAHEHREKAAASKQEYMTARANDFSRQANELETRMQNSERMQERGLASELAIRPHEYGSLSLHHQEAADMHEHAAEETRDPAVKSSHEQQATAHRALKKVAHAKEVSLQAKAGLHTHERAAEAHQAAIRALTIAGHRVPDFKERMAVHDKALEEHGTAAGWDEEKHPRDEQGRFT